MQCLTFNKESPQLEIDAVKVSAEISLQSDIA